MREHQYHKIQEELKRTDENQKKQVKKQNSSDENFSQSDISREEAEEANVLWMSTKKTTKFAFISNKEQGQDEQQKVSFLNLHINRHEENKWILSTKPSNSASNKVKLIKARKFKSSTENQPFLISGGLIALGAKNKSNINKSKKMLNNIKNSQTRPKSQHVRPESARGGKLE